MCVIGPSIWNTIGKWFAGIVVFIWGIFVVVLLLALITAFIGAFFEGVGAAPGLAAAGTIFYWLGAFLNIALAIFVILFILLLLDVVACYLWRLINGGNPNFMKMLEKTFGEFLDGIIAGGKYVFKTWAWYAQEYTLLPHIPIIGDIIEEIALADLPPNMRPCPSTTTIGELASTYTEHERDFPFGKSGAEVRQDAIAIAESEAIKRVTRALRREIDALQCQDGCTKTVSRFVVQLDGTTTVTVETGDVWDTYTATASAKGSAVVVCGEG